MRTRLVAGLLTGLAGVAVAFGAGATPDHHAWVGAAPADVHW